jgi:hypothetical protein
MPRKKTKEEFIKEAIMVHGNKYDYSKVVYVNCRNKVNILCREHGLFAQKPDTHISGSGCPKCAFNAERKLVYGVGMNDYDGFISVRQEQIKSYTTWKQILKRCYSIKSREKNKSYIGCIICDEWKLFTTFKEWFDENYIEGYEIDKDILGNGKLYSPQTCCFIPKSLNNTLVNIRNTKGYSKCRNKYSVSVSHSLNKKAYKTYIGCFSTPEEAFEAYKKAKEEYIKEVAEKYYKEGAISEKVYNALMNYEVEITD